jgi:hypothetical protein
MHHGCLRHLPPRGVHRAGTAVQHTFVLGCAPSFLALSGTLEAGLKLSATTRDGRLHTLRVGEAGVQPVQLEAQPVGLVSAGRSGPEPCVCCSQQHLHPACR